MAQASSVLSLRYRRLGRRRVYASLGTGLTLFCAALAAAALLAILAYVTVQGIGAINWAFLTQLPHPVGVPGGGVGNGIAGMVIVIGIATAMAVPVGLLTGIYLALFGRGAIPEALRFLSDVLSGVPSIAIGLFAYAVLVAPLKHFSGFSASFAFMMLMLPLLVRTSEQAIRSVPADRAGGSARARHVELPRHCTHRAADGAARDHHGAAARYRARHRGDGAAALHSLRHAVLGDESEQSDGSAVAAGLHLRHLALPELATTSMGRRAGTDRRGLSC